MRDRIPKFKSRVIEMLHSEWKSKRFGNLPLFALAVGLALMICGAGISDEEAPAARYLLKASYNIDALHEGLRQTEDEQIRAIIHYGKGSADAGGQEYPQVVVVDEDNNPLPADKIAFRILPPIDPEKGFKILNESIIPDQPEFPDGPPVLSFDMWVSYNLLPLLPEGAIEPPDSWEIDFRIFDLPLLRGVCFPARMRCEIVGREEMFGIPCIVIHYNLIGKYENQYYEGAPAFNLGGVMVKYSISVSIEGVLHYDPISRTVIAKQHKVDLRRNSDTLAELRDGTLAGWFRVRDFHLIFETNIHLIVDGDELQPE